MSFETDRTVRARCLTRLSGLDAYVFNDEKQLRTNVNHITMQIQRSATVPADLRRYGVL